MSDGNGQLPDGFIQCIIVDGAIRMPFTAISTPDQPFFAGLAEAEYDIGPVWYDDGDKVVVVSDPKPE